MSSLPGTTGRRMPQAAVLCAAGQRWDLAYAGFRAGASLERAWSARSELIDRNICSQGPQEARDRSAMMQALADPKAVEHMDAPSCERLYQWAIHWADGPLASALLDAGLRPNPQWTLRVDHARESVLVLSAKRESPGAFDVFKRCPAAAQAAQKCSHSTRSLRHIPVTRLLELHALGVAIDAHSPSEGNILHAWAELDSLPRPGWASLARELPHLFSQTDKHGETGVEKMRKKIRSQKAKDEFDASLVRVEAREIRSVAPASKAKKSGKARL